MLIINSYWYEENELRLFFKFFIIEDVYFVEIVGGLFRILFLKNMVTEIFGKELSIILNVDEVVVRGCVF